MTSAVFVDTLESDWHIHCGLAYQHVVCVWCARDWICTEYG